MLSELCMSEVIAMLSFDNALKLYEIADLYILEELKVNCLKFISMNIISYLGEQPEKVWALPVYLVRDLENFIKVKRVEKF